MERREPFVCQLCAQESLPGDTCSECGAPFESWPSDDTPFVPTGGFNSVFVTDACPTCHVGAQIWIGTNLGDTHRSSMGIGDAIVTGGDADCSRCPFEGVESWETLKQRDYWVFGSGRCLNCGNQVWARLEVRSNKLDRIVLIPRPEGFRSPGALLSECAVL
jgi:hypothetical protein